jgi:putative ABC transport system permease protein
VRFALRELRRRPGRFATATLILTLIAILLMFLGSLLDGLIASSTGAIRAQNGDVLVYSDASRASLARSLISPDLRAEIESVPGVAQTGGVGLVQLGARIPGAGERELAAVALFGIEIPPIGVVDVPPSGQVYADETLRADGVEIGTELLLGPARSPVEVIGFVSDTRFIGQASLWADAVTWRTVLEQNRPGARVGDGVFQALLVRTGTDAGELAVAIDATTGATEALTLSDAANALPGVEEQQGTFNQIIGVTLVIAVVVIGLFFALITVERASLYGVLKALGARSTTLFAGLIVQAAVVTVIASAIAASALVALGVAIPPGGLPLDVTPARIAVSTALLLVAAIAGCAFSLRRILRIDPASAIGSGP